MKECFESSLTPLKTALFEALSTCPTGTSDLQRLQLKLLSETSKCVRQTTSRVARDACAAFAADSSAFKLGRFPRFIDEVVRRLDTQASLSQSTEQGWLVQMLRNAAYSVEDWVESCKEERVQLRAQMSLVEPAKAKTLELLGIESEADVPQLVELQRVDLAQCTATGASLLKASVGRQDVFTVQMQTHTGLPLSAVLRSPSGDAVRATITDKGGGKYEGLYTVPEGTAVPKGGTTWQLAIDLHGCGIKGSPFDVAISDAFTNLQ